MNSSQISKVIFLSAILAAISFALTSTILPATPLVTAIMVFVAAFAIASTTKSNNADGSSEVSGEIKTLYVGNLPYRANEASIRELFSQYGHVQSVRLMKDKHTGKRRGFGFVEMSANDADTAVSSLNDQEFQQRTLKVREAKERPEKSDDAE
ncbi:MAG: RNA recognition motif domain-containing protein [Thalassotalea sp.]